MDNGKIRNLPQPLPVISNKIGNSPFFDEPPSPTRIPFSSGEKGLMRPIARPERKSRNAIFPDIPWRGSRPSEEEGKRENKRERERDFYHGSILVLRHRLSIFHFPLDPRQSFALGTRPSYFLPLPPAGGTYLTTVICISILLKRKYLIKLAGNVVSRRRRGRMPDPPYRNFASQFILSSRRIPRNLEYPSRMNDSSARRIPPPPFFSLLF